MSISISQIPTTELLLLACVEIPLRINITSKKQINSIIILSALFSSIIEILNLLVSENHKVPSGDKEPGHQPLPAPSAFAHSFPRLGATGMLSVRWLT